MAQNVELRRSNGTNFTELIYVKSHWSNIDGKPSNFPPTAHAHAITDITDLQTALNNKANTNHTHPEYYTEAMLNTRFAGLGYDSALQKFRYDTGIRFYNVASEEWVEDNFSKQGHNHIISNVDGLQTALNNKANTNHTHSQYLTSADIPDSISDFISNTPSDGSFLAFSTGVGWIATSLTSSLIPNLPASKITSGTFNASRIPSLSADKITSGVFSISRIPTGTTGTTVALGNHTHSNYVTTSGTAYNSTRWGGYQLRFGSGLSGASGYITFTY